MKIINSAKIPIYCWSDPLEDEALRQAENVANLPVSLFHVSLMPDAHSGYGMCIGGVAALDGSVSPYMVGNDAGCSVMAVRLDNVKFDDIEDMAVRKIVHDAIKREVPVGKHHNSSWKIPLEYDRAEKLMSMHGMGNDIICREAVADQLGTLGAGNHFGEVQIDENGSIWIMVHCGSRNIGSRVCTKYFDLAKKYCDEKNYILNDKHLAFLPMDHEHGIEYWKHMQFCLDFSHENKEVIVERVLRVLNRMFKKVSIAEKILIHHNFASVETHFGKQVIVHRKGATPAREGQLGIIPGDMGSYSFIVEGLGNPDSFESCSHGAGRAMSRQKARESISLSDVKTRMKGIYFDACKEIIEEAPGSYKNISQVMALQADLVNIVHTLSPLINIKDTSTDGSKKHVKNKDRTCPNGHIFGEDFERYNECKRNFCDERDRNACRHRAKIVRDKNENADR